MALACTTAPTLATHMKAGRITSQPGPMPNALKDAIKAPVPLLIPKAYRTP